ncbi:Eukaryotic translation initiation factor isoform 4E [Trifolium repens]|nr:Eukaryotic translation initiation factor isoform 4E [Trifolium repens]
MRSLRYSSQANPECANGGKWALTSKGKGNLHTVWLETLMALIGEQFGDSEDICGVVVSVRQWQDKLSLWTKTEANESVQDLEGEKEFYIDAKWQER